LADIVTSAGNAKAQYKKTPFDFVLRNGFIFTAYSTAGLWRNGGTGLMFGQAAGDYLKLPAVPGKKLVKMFYAWGITRTASTNHKIELRDPDGNTIPTTPEIAFAGDTKNDSKDHHQEGTFTFSGTNPGVQYTLYNVNGKNFGIGDLILYYE
jgi:hypothetical protein